MYCFFFSCKVNGSLYHSYSTNSIAKLSAFLFFPLIREMQQASVKDVVL